MAVLTAGRRVPPRLAAGRSREAMEGDTTRAIRGAASAREESRSPP